MSCTRCGLDAFMIMHDRLMLYNNKQGCMQDSIEPATLALESSGPTIRCEADNAVLVFLETKRIGQKSSLNYSISMQLLQFAGLRNGLPL